MPWSTMQLTQLVEIVLLLLTSEQNLYCNFVFCLILCIITIILSKPFLQKSVSNRTIIQVTVKPSVEATLGNKNNANFQGLQQMASQYCTCLFTSYTCE